MLETAEAVVALSRIYSAVFGLKGRHRPAQGRAKGRQPRSAALGSRTTESAALKGRNRRAAISQRSNMVFKPGRSFCPFRATAIDSPIPRAALCGCRRDALPWAGL